MPNRLDFAFVLLFAVVLTGIETAYFDRRFKARIAAGEPRARTDWYRRAFFGQWALFAITIGIWVHAGRPWGTLGLAPPRDWRLISTGIVVAAVTLFTIRQVRAIRRLGSDRCEALRGRLAHLEFGLPHTSSEHRWFILLSATAGVCEEVLYRGFLTWVAASSLGLPVGILLANLCFGFAHAYQGVRGIAKTAAGGIIMSFLVLATGWLIPAMIVHALVDAASGELAFRIYSKPGEPAAALTAAD